MVGKPSVNLFDDQVARPTQKSCRQEFFCEQTLERWSHAIAPAIRSAHTVAGINYTSTLVVGISEGGAVAVQISNVLPNLTYVAPPMWHLLPAEARSRCIEPPGTCDVASLIRRNSCVTAGGKFRSRFIAQPALSTTHSVTDPGSTAPR